MFESETAKSAEDLSAAATDVKDTLDTVKARGAQRYAAARDKVMEQWAGTKEDLDQLRQKAVDYSQTAVRATNTFAHDHPWTTAGAAIGVGAVIGWLMSRRSDSGRTDN